MEVYEVYVAYFFSGIATPAARNAVPFLRVILNDSEESHRRTDGYMYFSLWPWDISLALNMTYFFYLSLRAAGCLAYSFDTPTICGLITIAVWLIVSAIAAIIFNKKAK